MLKKVVMVGLVLLLVVGLAGVAGCTSANPVNPSTTPASTAMPSSTPAPSSTPNPSSTPAPTATPTPQPPGPLPTQATVSGPSSVVQGRPIIFMTTLYSINEHKNVCGAVNYYVDDYAAGGTWNINPSGACSASSGNLALASADTAKLSLGTHTLKIDWLGDSNYGPSQASEQFTATSSPTPTPTPSPLPFQLVGDSATHVYHLPSCSWVHLISPAHLVYFNSAAEAEAAGYRPCEHCHPPT